MQISIILPNTRTITHWVSDVNIRINRIFQKCTSKQKDTRMSIRFFLHSMDNVVNGDNSLVEYLDNWRIKVDKPHRYFGES